MRILILIAICSIATSCSSGGNYNQAVALQRLLLVSTPHGGNEIDLTVAGSNTGDFPAVTYYIYGTDIDMGVQTMIPMKADRLNEQAFGPFVHGDTPQNIDLTPWENYTTVYLRALLVTPNKGWKLEPGRSYDFSTN